MNFSGIDSFASQTAGQLRDEIIELRLLRVVRQVSGFLVACRSIGLRSIAEVMGRGLAGFTFA